MSVARMGLLALVIEALTVLVLIVMVAVTGPSDPGAAQAYAERLGTWVGPLAGFILCVLGGWFIARKLDAGHVKKGLLLGAMVAVIDLAILLGSGAGLQPLFVVSNLGRLVAGALGGFIASRSVNRIQSD